MTLSFLFPQLEHIMDADRWLGVGGKLAFLLMTHQSDSMHHPAGQGSAVPRRTSIPGGHETGWLCPAITKCTQFPPLKKKKTQNRADPFKIRKVKSRRNENHVQTCLITWVLLWLFLYGSISKAGGFQYISALPPPAASL